MHMRYSRRWSLRDGSADADADRAQLMEGVNPICFDWVDCWCFDQHNKRQQGLDERHSCCDLR